MSKEPKDEGVEREVKRRLAELERLYGRVPLVAQVLSTRPDIFLAYSDYSDVALNRPMHLDRKTAELAAVAAGSALASQHCLNVHLEAAIKAGANDDEILESVLIGSFMAMTRSQSVALRMFQEMHDGLEPKKE
ncbi:MAG: carboxymuconolactone decarboxylase family protein [Methanomassiliicoccales archaeon]|nr:carboxymuconolactone decarboxylase family protein [Methanomassiliicoccales archaeon]